MKFVAFLRGINVGGNALIKMSSLKAAVENSGFKNVSTYIASGNVLFESDEPADAIRDRLEKDLSKTFGIDLRIVIRSQQQLEHTLLNVPPEWDKSKDLRCYMAFVREPTAAEDVLKEIQLKEEVDSVKVGPGVLYLTTKLEGIVKSGFNKLATKKLCKEITIRTHNTSKKMVALMKKSG